MCPTVSQSSVDEIKEGEIYSVDPKTVFVHEFQVIQASFPSHPEHDNDAPTGVACSVSGHYLVGKEFDAEHLVHFVMDMPTAANFAGAIADILMKDLRDGGGENHEGT